VFKQVFLENKILSATLSFIGSMHQLVLCSHRRQYQSQSDLNTAEEGDEKEQREEELLTLAVHNLVYNYIRVVKHLDVQLFSLLAIVLDFT
jgi:hypothetical protein